MQYFLDYKHTRAHNTCTLYTLIVMDLINTFNTLTLFSPLYRLAERVEIFTAEKHPKKVELGTREIPFTGAVYIDREDFFDTGIDGTIPAPKGFKRLLPGGQVRLKYTYVITCDDVIRDDKGEVVELVCSYDERTRAGMTPEGAKKVRLMIDVCYD